MLHAVKGQTPEGRHKAHGIVHALQTKRPEAELFTFSDTSWSSDKFNELLSSRGLFESKYIILLDQTFKSTDAKEYIMSQLKDLASSDHAFVLYEENFDATTLKKIEKHAHKIHEIEENKTPQNIKSKKEEFNVFKLSDALGSRDKKSLWLIFNEMLRRGVVAEEMHGILWWQIKSMLIICKTKNVGESGLNPFVYKKSLQYASNFKKGELNKIANDLIDMYHKAHRGEVDFMVELEKFVLGI